MYTQVKKKIIKNNKDKQFLRERTLLLEKLSTGKTNQNPIEIEQKIINLILVSGCKFGYNNKNAKKHGHLKKTIDRKTNQITYEIKIAKDDNEAAKLYTLVHEYTHFYNKHLDTKELSKKQAEVVADTVAMIVIRKMNLQEELRKSKMSFKWNIDKYSEHYIRSMQYSEIKKKIIFKQIIETVDHLQNSFKLDSDYDIIELWKKRERK